MNNLRNFSVLIVTDLKAFARKDSAITDSLSPVCLEAGSVDRTIHVKHIA